MKFGLADKSIDLIKQAMSKFETIEKVAVFGSRAMGNYRPGSDVDIALYGNIEPSIRDQLSVQLNEVLPLPYFFDIVVVAQLTNQDLIKHIKDVGLPLYDKEEGDADEGD